MNKLLSSFLLLALTIAHSSIASAAPISGQGTWESTLQGRDLDGNLSTVEAYYDTTLNITWLADANFAYGSSYDAADGVIDGRTSWANAMNWATNLNPYSSGIIGWQLPEILDTGAPGCNFAFSGSDCGANVDVSTSAMAHMFYVTLGNLSRCDGIQCGPGSTPQPGGGLTNTGLFQNIYDNNLYLSRSTDYHQDTAVLRFNFNNGFQNRVHKNDKHYAWAIHDGDVGAAVVPVPASAWLLLSGLIALTGISRNKR